MSARTVKTKWAHAAPGKRFRQRLRAKLTWLQSEDQAAENQMAARKLHHARYAHGTGIRLLALLQKVAPRGHNIHHRLSKNVDND